MEPDRVVIHDGWFAGTVPVIGPIKNSASFTSTATCISRRSTRLATCFSVALSTGAVICFDDWNCGQADPNSGERRAWRDLAERYAIVYSDWRAYSTMGRSFFIHDYRRGNTPISSGAAGPIAVFAGDRSDYCSRAWSFAECERDGRRQTRTSEQTKRYVSMCSDRHAKCGRKAGRCGAERSRHMRAISTPTVAGLRSPPRSSTQRIRRRAVGAYLVRRCDPTE